MATQAVQTKILSYRARKQEDQFFRLSLDMVCVAGVDGYFKRLNPMWSKTLGFTTEELLGKQYIELVHPEDREATLAEAGKLALGEDTIGFENRYRCADGSYKWLLWNAARSSDGQLIYASARDISDRKNADALLSQQSQIIDQIHDAVIATDLQGYITCWNQGAERLFGTPRNAAIGRQISFIYPECERKFLQKHIIQPLLSKRTHEAEVRMRRNKKDPGVVGEKHSGDKLGFHSKFFSGNASPPSGLVVRSQESGVRFQVSLKNQKPETRLLDSEYEDFWGHVSLSQLRDKQGSAIGIIYSCHDITRRKLAESALKQANEELEDKVEARTAALKGAIGQLQTEIAERKRVEEQLRASQEMLQLILDNIPQFIAWKDLNSVYQGCNRNLARIAGVGSPENIVGKTDYDLAWKPEEADNLRSCDRRVMETNSPEYHIIEAQLQADGKQIWLDKNRIPLHDSDGNVVGILVTCEDITERVQAEEALAKSEAKFRSLIQNSSDLITIEEPDGVMRYQSPSIERILGFKPDELIGKNAFEFVHPDDLGKTTATFSELVQNAGAVVSVEYRFKKNDGSWCWLESTVSNLLYDRAVGGIAVNSRDITDRKQAESALRQSERSLREQAQQLEKALHDLRSYQSQLIQTEKMSSLGLLVAGVAHEINNPVNFIHGNLIHARHYIKDLLGLLHLYQQQYPEPVPEIEAAAEAADLDFLIEDLPRLLSSMEVGSERIRQIVLSLRNFSRLDEAQMKTVDIHEGLENTLLILQHRLKATAAKGLEPHATSGVEVIKEYCQLPKVECYAGQLNQVFMNILSNAMDALEEQGSKGAGEQGSRGAREIRIRTEVIDGDRVAIRIADNGPGMTEDVCRRLFDPFFTTKPVGKGTGLGLSISYQIVVEKHGGQLKCVSAPGEGTEFVISIPIKQSLR